MGKRESTGGRLDVQRRIMFTETGHTPGFAVPAHQRASHGSSLPALIAIIALVLSTAIVLTVTVTAARAAHLF